MQKTAIRLHNRGLSCLEISLKLGVELIIVMDWIRVPQDAIRRFQDGQTVVEIANVLGHSPSIIRGWLRQAGVNRQDRPNRDHIIAFRVDDQAFQALERASSNSRSPQQVARDVVVKATRHGQVEELIA